MYAFYASAKIALSFRKLICCPSVKKMKISCSGDVLFLFGIINRLKLFFEAIIDRTKRLAIHFLVLKKIQKKFKLLEVI